MIIFILIFQGFSFFYLNFLFLNLLFKILNLVLKDQVPGFFSFVELVHRWTRKDSFTSTDCIRIILILYWHVFLRTIDFIDLIEIRIANWLDIEGSPMTFFTFLICTAYRCLFRSHVILLNMRIFVFVLIIIWLVPFWLPIQAIHQVLLLLTLQLPHSLLLKQFLTKFSTICFTSWRWS